MRVKGKEGGAVKIALAPEIGRGEEGEFCVSCVFGLWKWGDV